VESLRQRLFLIGLLLALGVAVFHLTWSRRGLRDLLALREEEVQLRAQCQQIESENAVLTAQIEQLRFDDEYLQSLIRRKLGLVRQDELIYRFGFERHPATR
jgi:cell division protein FtsB